jgi:DNA polymerase III subunit gamma/tau
MQNPSLQLETPDSGGYRVLARKYRPTHFGDLIGQEALVRTLSNSFDVGRIAQAWMLTGVRGVGKTTTARILARALNYQTDGGVDKPTVDMPSLGVHCASIMESRHVDVLEMDAASRTGIDDVREILEGVRYAPVSARYKVYIIDEVHMLSDKAFNAFLKTLEEPPPHVKFIFATTEVRKVPVTVLSRCQRFSLRRVDSGVLATHLRKVMAAEGIDAEDEALAMIARAAEGSVRDSLSMLDQAIAHGGGQVGTAAVRAMLGLSARGRIVDLFDALMAGHAAEAVTVFRDLYDNGADAVTALMDVAEFVHFVTRVKLSAAALDDASVTQVERERAQACAQALSHKVLARAWQILLKGIAEVQAAPKPAQAADMVLVRLACAADLPFPDDALRALTKAAPSASASPAPSAHPLSSGGASSFRGSAALAASPQALAARATPAPAASASPARVLMCFEDMRDLAKENRDITLKIALEQDVHLVRFEDGMLEFRAGANASPELSSKIQRQFTAWTGRRWIVVVSRDEGQPTLRQQAEDKQQALRSNAERHPDVQAVLSRFPGAKIINVRQAPVAPVQEDAVPDAQQNVDMMEDRFDA